MPILKKSPPRESVRVRVRTPCRGSVRDRTARRGSVCVRSRPIWVSASFQIFALIAGVKKCPRWGGKLSGRGKYQGKYVRGKCPISQPFPIPGTCTFSFLICCV